MNKFIIIFIIFIIIILGIIGKNIYIKYKEKK
jgi:hypothetical protein